MRGKIALEEHVSTPDNNRLWDSTGEAGRNGKEYMKDVERRLLDRSIQLEEMAQRHIDHVILSLTSPGAQSILDKAKAVSFARDTNDFIVENYVKPNPDKFSAFATLALQNPEAAAEELERAVNKLGMKGALINGYTNVKDSEHGLYLDDESMLVFWDKVNELNVPVYLHPREPLEGPARGIYTGYESLIGSAWGFAQETAVHAIRLMMSGLFDRYPNLNLVLGHLGEGLVHMLPRTQHRLYRQRFGCGLGKAEKPLMHYLQNNFIVTTSGHFNTHSLNNAIEVMGADRVMFSVDYPYEDIHQACDWFDPLELEAGLKDKIAWGNASRVFNIQ
ncbi:amidohydrolase family protein [Klebsiella variicola]|uniref:amidohydrolase family protein n=1 Tax=Klebsiella variicola TaxID=244366 RepID=UPI002B05936F|nr:amidohydrolase family protein [Klebsiella variicola]